MDTVEIYGVTFLKCEKEDCDWNIGYTPYDLNRSGLEFTYRSGTGVRVCNFGCKALAYGKNIDVACPHKRDVCSLLGENDQSHQCRFWGSVDPEVAGRVLNVEPE
jgi:hypothetical protein